MSIFKFFVSVLLLIGYGYLFFVAFGPVNIDIYHTADNKLLLEYDYIVIGAGSAGSVVSSRLAQNNNKVLVLEAGVSNSVDIITMPVGFPQVFVNPNYSYIDWGYKATYRRGSFEKEIIFPRGKIVGGCGSINANVWNIGSHKIYDKWEEKGAKGWKWSNIEKYFQKASETLWIEKYPGKVIHKVSRDIVDVASKLYGSTESLNVKTLGFGYCEATLRNGRRWSTADAYLKPTLRKFQKNFHLRLNSTVNKIVFNKEGDRAVGVLLDNNKIIKAKKEIILSAGAFNSPTLLMRSGIGNKTTLEKFGIKAIKELPGVGQHLQTHATISLNLMVNVPGWETIKEEPPKMSNILDYLLFGTGTFSSNIAEVAGYFKTNFANFKDVEDIHIHCAPLFYAVDELYLENKKIRPNSEDFDYFTCIVSTVSARDKGEVGLKSLDPNDKVDIKINFLKHEEDMKSMLEGISAMKKVFEQDTFKDKITYIFPKKEELEDENKLKEYINRSIFEVYHPTGTCRMGDVQNDPMAVVDNRLKLKGVANVRVIDASVIPEIPNSNTNAATVTIAEKGAELILNENK